MSNNIGFNVTLSMEISQNVRGIELPVKFILYDVCKLSNHNGNDNVRSGNTGNVEIGRATGQHAIRLQYFELCSYFACLQRFFPLGVLLGFVSDLSTGKKGLRQAHEDNILSSGQYFRWFRIFRRKRDK